MSIKNKNKKLTLFLTLSVSGLLLLNFTLISAYIVLKQFGSVTLSPGEKYTINIPFIGPSKSPLICGKAQQTDGTLLANIKVIVEYSSNHSKVGEATTGADGKYCITLPEIKTSRAFDIFVKYDNVTSTGEPLVLASNDYSLKFENNKIYNKTMNSYAVLTGNITNQDAKIENGRFEVNLKYQNESNWIEIFDYKYSVNIEPNDLYSIPNDELNVSWHIPINAETTRYKFYVKTSFNAEDRTSTIYFNVTG